MIQVVRHLALFHIFQLSLVGGVYGHLLHLRTGKAAPDNTSGLWHHDACHSVSFSDIQCHSVSFSIISGVVMSCMHLPRLAILYNFMQIWQLYRNAWKACAQGSSESSDSGGPGWTSEGGTSIRVWGSQIRSMILTVQARRQKLSFELVCTRSFEKNGEAAPCGW